MGIQDRDYYKDNPRPTGGLTGAGSMASHLGQMRLWRVATWLIAINVAVFVIDAILAGAGVRFIHLIATVDGQTWRELFPLVSQVENLPRDRQYVVQQPMQLIERWGYFSVTTALAGLQVWRWITFQFLHAGIGHLLGNMIGLYFFGPVIEDYLGKRRFLAFYLLCGIAGPVVYLLFALTGILATSPITPLIGASAGVFGILLAAAQVAPRAQVMLLFPPIPMQLRTLAYVLLGVAAFTVFTQGRNAGGEAAHLGGAALGFLLIKNPRFLNWAEKLSPRALFSRRGKGDGDKGNMKYHGWR
jgi:membrane associated rhomboid family serine protease